MAQNILSTSMQVTPRRQCTQNEGHADWSMYGSLGRRGLSSLNVAVCLHKSTLGGLGKGLLLGQQIIHCRNTEHLGIQQK